MRKIKLAVVMFFAFTLFFIPSSDVFAGAPAVLNFAETDGTNLEPFEDVGGAGLFYFFDLRDRETFIQLTYPDGEATGLPARAHIQIFDVSNNCNENDFFDDYTINDTHIYNMRDIQTNDGNPSGVVLPDGSYGIVAITIFAVNGADPDEFAGAFGNLRIIDNNGYEYRTNAQGIFEQIDFGVEANSQIFYSFNFNQQGGVSLADVVGITLFSVDLESFEIEYTALPVQGLYSPFDIDIYDLNEVPFSCRDVIFSCVDEDNPLLEEVLSVAASANVASFEYGINNAIPHSKGGELLCPGNTITDGAVILRPESYTEEAFNIWESLNDRDTELPLFVGFVGLNNGNGRGSMDAFWSVNGINLQQ